jgi:ubiquinone/menaquinone biosynthesis C-methylase UbiE
MSPLKKKDANNNKNDYYDARVRAIGFHGFGHVLDAGCGDGNWSLALSKNNRRVSGVDLDGAALWQARRKADEGKRRNIGFCHGDLHDLPYQDDAFDAVLCYGVLMLTQEDRVMGELARVMRPGGILYLSSDGSGWPFFKILKFGLKERSIVEVSRGINILISTLFHRFLLRRYHRRRTFLRRRDVTRLFRENGLHLGHFGVDGTYGNEGGNRFVAPFGIRILGCPADFEALGIKHVRQDGDA